jgi:DnaJ-class molecular chaperone
MDLGRMKSRNNWRARGRGNLRGQWRGRANVADTGQRGAFNCFSCREEGHYAKNCPRCQGKGRTGAKANLINFDPEEDTLYKGSQAEGSRVALVKTEMEAMSFNERQELIKELAGEEDKDFHSA